MQFILFIIIIIICIRILFNKSKKKKKLRKEQMYFKETLRGYAFYSRLNKDWAVLDYVTVASKPH